MTMIQRSAANRLVASELEARWNKELAHAAEVEGKIATPRRCTADACQGRLPLCLS
jgi:hypothetical protein